MDKRQKESKHTYKICPKCKFFCSTREGDKFCSYCGEELIAGCQNCKTDINNPYAHFCRLCGEKFPGRGEQVKSFKES